MLEKCNHYNTHVVETVEPHGLMFGENILGDKMTLELSKSGSVVFTIDGRSNPPVTLEMDEPLSLDEWHR